ncbi:MAG TPA: P27 family phage terminase small subunit [Bryobacteraceae bacterium]|nr:P27 family phage terminase small subunit [Bryobacteraceae bacterium]
MAGRPKAAKAKNLEGNPGKRPVREPVRGELGIDRMPSHLAGQAAVHWRFFVDHLQKRGDLEKIDGPALADCCICFARMLGAEKAIEELGILVEGARGLVKNPALQIAREYRTKAQRYIELFGFAPGPRNRMTMPDLNEDADPQGLLD